MKKKMNLLKCDSFRKEMKKYNTLLSILGFSIHFKSKSRSNFSKIKSIKFQNSMGNKFLIGNFESSKSL
jgi:hypothetical protein